MFAILQVCCCGTLATPSLQCCSTALRHQYILKRLKRLDRLINMTFKFQISTKRPIRGSHENLKRHRIEFVAQDPGSRIWIEKDWLKYASLLYHKAKVEYSRSYSRNYLATLVI